MRPTASSEWGGAENGKTYWCGGKEGENKEGLIEVAGLFAELRGRGCSRERRVREGGRGLGSNEEGCGCFLKMISRG